MILSCSVLMLVCTCMLTDYDDIDKSSWLVQNTTKKSITKKLMVILIVNVTDSAW